MWIPNSIVALIFVGTLYSLIFERVKGNHFENKKAPRRQSERKTNKLKNIKIRDYCITKRSNYERKKSVCQN